MMKKKVLFALFLCFLIKQAPALSGKAPVATSKAFLRLNDDSSPFCYVASNAVDVMGRAKANFLATQVWPSARVAAALIEQHLLDRREWSVVCEFGCGPGLPSIAAARAGAQRVIATDLDELALELVQKAASAQDLSDVLTTEKFDFLDVHAKIPPADLYVLSDVFQSGAVAEGAARVCRQILKDSPSHVWVFAQSDRAQREVFLAKMNAFQEEEEVHSWQPSTSSPSRLWLVDINELDVNYV